MKNISICINKLNLKYKGKINFFFWAPQLKFSRSALAHHIRVYSQCRHESTAMQIVTATIVIRLGSVHFRQLGEKRISGVYTEHTRRRSNVVYCESRKNVEPHTHRPRKSLQWDCMLLPRGHRDDVFVRLCRFYRGTRCLVGRTFASFSIHFLLGRHTNQKHSAARRTYRGNCSQWKPFAPNTEVACDCWFPL